MRPVLTLLVIISIQAGIMLLLLTLHDARTNQCLNAPTPAASTPTLRNLT